MLQKLKALFTSTPPVTPVPFVDPVLGEFAFDNELGWKKSIEFGDGEAELVIGSVGKHPTDKMIQTARMWVERWCTEKPRILDYIRKELGEWNFEPDLPNPDSFTLQSVNVFWQDKPDTCMLYFNYPGDEIRLWHCTFDGTTPRGFSYDD